MERNGEGRKNKLARIVLVARAGRNGAGKRNERCSIPWALTYCVGSCGSLKELTRRGWKRWPRNKLSAEMRGGIIQLAERLPVVLEVAKDIGVEPAPIVAGSRPPHLPPPPVSLRELEHSDWCDEELIGEFRWRDRKGGHVE